MHALSKYLEQWAEPETALAAQVEGPYERTLVVPACAESATLADGWVDAAQTSSGRTLAIVVVNGSDEAADDVHAENAALLEGLRGRLKRARDVPGPVSATIGALQGGKLDVLVVDRASPGARVPRKEGVGLARKIGSDVALALHARGSVRSRYIFATDADARLPATHFDVEPLDDYGALSAVLFPFWHEAGESAEVTQATSFYELSLRYYVAGLAAAGSPYAFHTLGSAMAFTAEAYAAVRGYPKREAAEDFYLLNKIAKIGPVARFGVHPVRIASRSSSRTPFGTGAAVSQALAHGDRLVHSPRVFELLGAFLGCLEAFAEEGDVGRFFEGVSALPEGPRAVVNEALTELDAEKALMATAADAKTALARRIRVHTWFDAFRTLKLVHGLRDRVEADLPFARAVETAPFSPVPSMSGNVPDAAPSVVALRYAFLRKETTGPLFSGPWAPRP